MKKQYSNPDRIYKIVPLSKMEGRERTREMVRIRDKHKCQDCKKKWIEGKRRFDIHHLNKLCGKKSRSYDKVSEMKGLITLCHKCHYARPEHRVHTVQFSNNVSKGHENSRKEKESKFCPNCHMLIKSKYHKDNPCSI